MRNGLRVYDSDTHVEPSAEVLERYVDPGFRPRLSELAPYRTPVGSPMQGHERHLYRYGQKFYRRKLGEAGPHDSFTGRETKWRGSKTPRVGVQDDEAANRLADMDDEGTDAHFLVPTSWTSLVGLGDAGIEQGIIRAYHRHMEDFSKTAPGRLTSSIVACTRDVPGAVAQIKEWGKSKWAVAVMPLLASDMPADHPGLDPIWQAAVEYNLPIVQHSFTWTPPYFPGYQDLWDNIFLVRLASHPWGAMRFMASIIGGGVLDRFPTLRMGILECGFGWLPFWARRMDEQALYVGGIAPLKQAPSDYLKSGRFFCSIERHEGEDMFNTVTQYLGDDVLMYASDYPHSECQFPDSVDNIFDWSTLNAATRKKLLWENAARLYRVG
jgi:predicted TIM-barrel fold metal-dependent hydrolase